jgi:ABC-2 type transport system permease protein
MDPQLPTGLGHWIRVFGGFIRMDFVQAISYPLAFVMSQLTSLAPVIIYFFVAELLTDTPATVGGDYFTYVVIGLAGFGILGGGLRGFGSKLELSLQYGQFEALLIEPIKWRLLPFAMAQWSLIMGTVHGLIVLIAGGFLGAEYSLSGILPAALIVFLAMAASVAIGSLAASLLLLAKKSQTVLTLYTLAASVLSGVFFPIDLLPDSVRMFSWIIPHTYAINSLRGVLMEQPPEGAISLSASVVALSVFNIVVFPLAIWLFGKSLEEGRKMGMLGSY